MTFTRCPRCSSRDTVKLVYGPLTPRLRRRVESGKARWGGEALPVDRPDRHCNGCGYEWETALGRATRTAGPPGGSA